MVAGYSGTPLPKKLGIREGSRVGYRGAPKGLAATLGQLPLSARLAPSRPGGVDDILLLFAPDQRSLDEALPDMLSRMAPETSLWICWPKKTSPLASDITGDTVRRTGLAAGVVDIKVCAIDEDWSGLKFVIRLEDRPSARKKCAPGVIRQLQPKSEPQ